MEIHVRPLTDNCAQILERGEHVVVGLSPFNSYYKPHTVEYLISWAVHRFANVNVLLPGYQATYAMIATGMEPRRAARRTQRAIVQLRAPASRALRRAGITEPECQVQTWTQLANQARYRAVHRRGRDAVREHQRLRELCRDLSAAALATAGSQNVTEHNIDRMTDYVLAELPFFVDSPGIYGTSSSVFVYHRRIATLDLLFTGSIPTLCPVASQAFVAVTIDPDSANHTIVASATGSTSREDSAHVPCSYNCYSAS